MRASTRGLVAVMILLSFTVGVKAVSAATRVAHLTLDAGFVGRPVQLDLFDGDVSISWDSEALKAPTFLVVSVEDVDASAQAGASSSSRIAGNTVRMLFSDGGAINLEKGVFVIRERALTPPTSTERPVIFLRNISNPIQGTFGDVSVTYRVPARADLSITPQYEEGIMRSGMASWYRYKNCLCAASPDVPKGTKLKVSRQDDPSRFVIVTVNDYGPDRRIHPERVIDLDYVAFAKIGNPRGGVLAVNVEKVE